MLIRKETPRKWKFKNCYKIVFFIGICSITKITNVCYFNSKYFKSIQYYLQNYQTSFTFYPMKYRRRYCSLEIELCFVCKARGIFLFCYSRFRQRGNLRDYGICGPICTSCSENKLSFPQRFCSEMTLFRGDFFKIVLKRCDLKFYVL